MAAKAANKAAKDRCKAEAKNTLLYATAAARRIQISADNAADSYRRSMKNAVQQAPAKKSLKKPVEKPAKKSAKKQG
jgi:hypothetical protein